MSHELPLADEWIATHLVQYNQLFDDGRVREHEIDFTSEPTALSALARYTDITRRARKLEYTTMAEIAMGVEATLDACDQGTFGPTIGAMLCRVDNVPPEMLKSATARVITHWERACLRRELPSPFEGMMIKDVQPEDIELDATQLVIMTAVAFAVVLRSCSRRRPATVPRWAVNGLKYYGPGFTADFIQGSDPHELLDPDASSANTALTTSERKHVLATSPQTPAATLAKITANLDVPPPEELAKILGWDTERTNTIFTPSAIRRLALNRRDKPFLVTAQRIRHLYDNILTPEALGDSLGISPTQAEFAFNSSLIHTIVLHSPDADPVSRLRDILTLTRNLTNRFPISYPLALWLAAYLPSQSLDRAALVEKELPNRPPRVSERLWAWAVARHPMQGDPKRFQLINRSAEYWNFLNTLSLTAQPDHNSSLEERHADSMYSPEYIFFGDDAMSNLRDTVHGLLDRANLSASEQKQLLKFFRDEDAEPTPVIAGLLEQVRQAAGQ
jgi:hypothetical protein